MHLSTTSNTSAATEPSTRVITPPEEPPAHGPSDLFNLNPRKRKPLITYETHRKRSRHRDARVLRLGDGDGQDVGSGDDTRVDRGSSVTGDDDVDDSDDPLSLSPSVPALKATTRIEHTIKTSPPFPSQEPSQHDQRPLAAVYQPSPDTLLVPHTDKTGAPGPTSSPFGWMDSLRLAVTESETRPAEKAPPPPPGVDKQHTKLESPLHGSAVTPLPRRRRRRHNAPLSFPAAKSPNIPTRTAPSSTTAVGPLRSPLQLDDQPSKRRKTFTAARDAAGVISISMQRQTRTNEIERDASDAPRPLAPLQTTPSGSGRNGGKMSRFRGSQMVGRGSGSGTEDSGVRWGVSPGGAGSSTGRRSLSTHSGGGDRMAGGQGDSAGSSSAFRQSTTHRRRLQLNPSLTTSDFDDPPAESSANRLQLIVPSTSRSLMTRRSDDPLIPISIPIVTSATTPPLPITTLFPNAPRRTRSSTSRPLAVLTTRNNSLPPQRLAKSPFEPVAVDTDEDELALGFSKVVLHANDVVHEDEREIKARRQGQVGARDMMEIDSPGTSASVDTPERLAIRAARWRSPASSSPWSKVGTDEESGRASSTETLVTCADPNSVHRLEEDRDHRRNEQERGDESKANTRATTKHVDTTRTSNTTMDSRHDDGSVSTTNATHDHAKTTTTTTTRRLTRGEPARRARDRLVGGAQQTISDSQRARHTFYAKPRHDHPHRDSDERYRNRSATAEPECGVGGMDEEEDPLAWG